MQEAQQGMEIDALKLRQLNRSERLLLGLYFYESLTVADIAVIMQKSPEVVQDALDAVFGKLLQESPVETPEFAGALFEA